MKEAKSDHRLLPIRSHGETIARLIDSSELESAGGPFGAPLQKTHLVNRALVGLLRRKAQNCNQDVFQTAWVAAPWKKAQRPIACPLLWKSPLTLPFNISDRLSCASASSALNDLYYVVSCRGQTYHICTLAGLVHTSPSTRTSICLDHCTPCLLRPGSHGSQLSSRCI